MARQVAPTKVELMPGTSNMAGLGVYLLLYMLLTTVNVLLEDPATPTVAAAR